MLSRRQKLGWLLALALVLFVARHIYRWGGPVPLGNLQGMASPLAGRQLVLCVDGVPFSEMESLWQGWHFRDFFAPSRLISTFPSDSEVALTAILHAPPALGYENRYFDRTEGRVRGGIRVTLAQSSPYLQRQRYDEPAIFKGIQFILPLKTFRADLGRMRRRFLASREPVFVAHISSTDAVYHVRSREFMRQRLLELEAVLRDLFRESGGQLRILLYSDHGNTLVQSRRAPLDKALERAGFRLGDSIERPRSVVIPSFGLVSFAPVYTRAEEKAEVARVLSAAEGVELVAYQQTGGLMLLSRRGRARLRWKELGGDMGALRFRYDQEGGDPLLLADTWRQLRADPEGYVADADLFAATAFGSYPDAAFRLADWAVNHVQNRADIVVSLADGYYYGSRLFEKIVTLQSTHGGLDAGSSAGFAMSTAGRLPPALRYNQLLPRERSW